MNKEYDLISIGTGSAMNIVEAMMAEDSQVRIAVIDKDEPGGICLTRGCIPSKLLLYPAEMLRTIEERAEEIGLNIQIGKIDFPRIMKRMRSHIGKDIEAIRNGLSQSKNIDYYHDTAEFVEPYVLRLGRGETIRSKMIFLCTGSKPIIPPIKGLKDVKYHTSDSILSLEKLPASIAIIGGGYIAAEYGHFFSSMGSDVTIIGRNKQFLPQEEPEVSWLAKRELENSKMKIITNGEVVEVIDSTLALAQRNYENHNDDGHNNDDDNDNDYKILTLVIRDTTGGENQTVAAQEILVAAGRGPNSDILHPERGGIRTDDNGWIVVDDYLETSQPNIWAFGDANGVLPFKHKANYESQLVYYNAVLKKKVKKSYDAVPHAVFTYPEIAAVGLGEGEALQKYGRDNILIGFERYEDTAKGAAMAVKDYFVKVIVRRDTSQIIGAHIVGSDASILIQEIINVMYSRSNTARTILEAMHIHPALSEVVQRSFSSLMVVDEYHRLIEEDYGFLRY
jgi:dihydrolipoamide dehydrogenase